MNKETPKNAVKYLRVLYPIWFLIAIYSLMYVPSTLIDYTDPKLTVDNLTNNKLIFRVGIAGRLTTQILFIIIPLLLFKLFESVNKNVAIVMVAFALVSVPITMSNEINNLIITSILEEQNMVMNSLESYNQGMRISTIFWGLWLLPLAWLVDKSNYFPKLISIALYIAGAGYIMNSFNKIVLPDFSQLNLFLELMTLGELVFIIWLVVKGVKFNTI